MIILATTLVVTFIALASQIVNNGGDSLLGFGDEPTSSKFPSSKHGADNGKKASQKVAKSVVVGEEDKQQMQQQQWSNVQVEQPTRTPPRVTEQPRTAQTAPVQAPPRQFRAGA